MFNSKYASIERVARIPRLMVGFDTETTGLWRPSSEQPESMVRNVPNENEPTSYGIVVYRDGKLYGRPEQYLVKPNVKMEPEARKVSRLDETMLADSYNGDHIRTMSADKTKFNAYQPAIGRNAGFVKAAHRLGELQRMGAVIVGANVEDFDLAMLKHHYEKATGLPLHTSGLDLDRLPILDVIRHHQAMTGEEKRRALSDSPTREKTKDTLCDIYGITSGDHSAKGDAIASLEVALRQMATNRGEFMPNNLRLGSVKQSFNSGMPYESFSTCTGKADCPTCGIINRTIADNKDENGNLIDPSIDASHQTALNAHKVLIPQAAAKFNSKESK